MAGKVEAQYVAASVLLTALCITLIPHMYVDKRVKKEKKKQPSISIGVAALMLFFILSGMPPLLSDAGMSFIGVRKNNVTILLQGNDIEMARQLTGDEKQLYFKGNALFTGIGTTSLLVINHKSMVFNNGNLTLSF